MVKALTRMVSFLLVAACAFVGCTKVSKEANAANPQAAKQSDIQAAAVLTGAVPDKVAVYYFHFTRRCRTCLGIQATIEKTIKDRFGMETKAGTLAFQDINLDLPENSHFVKDYNLSFSAMVVVAKKGQAPVKWQNCDKVWDLAHNEPELTEYADKQIRAYVDMLKKS
jgi:hypothetical protein